jgi:hypothetical protein
MIRTILDQSARDKRKIARLPRRPIIPNPMPFEGIGMAFWSGTPEFRCPNRGEWFASGAIVEGYRARQHLTTEYWVVKPTHYARPVQAWRQAGEIQFTQGGVPIPRKPTV